MSIVEENWNYYIDLCSIEKIQFRDFELHVNEVCNDIMKLLEDSFLQNTNCQIGTGQSYDEDLKLLVDKNRQLRQQIEIKVKEVSRQQTQYESYKQDQKLLSKEVKETHEAFLMAKKYYKKFLKMYYAIESRSDNNQVIFIQFFTESKKESENYSVRLSKDLQSKQYDLVSTIPKLKMFNELKKILHETQDVLGALYSIREEFISLKKSKK